MVSNKIEGKKTAASTPSKKLKLTKKVTPNKEEKNPFVGKVKVTNVDDDNADYCNLFFDSWKVEIDAKTPPQSQRKSTIKGGKVMFYNPSVGTKKHLVTELKKQLDNDHKKFSGPVLVNVRIYRKIPKSNPTNIQKGDYCITIPDIDNLQKFLYDALAGLFYHNDCQIASVDAFKQYDDRDHVEIIIANKKTKTTVMYESDDNSFDSDDTEEVDEIFNLHGDFIRDQEQQHTSSK